MKKSLHHSIDFIFPIALFFIFSSMALIVLLFGANIYQNVVTSSKASFEQSTTLAYVSEKIRQNNSSDAEICIKNYDGLEALAISQTYNGSSYVTYIYEMDGMLKELFVEEDVYAPAAAGTTIMEVYAFDMQELENGLLKFTCTASDNHCDSVILSIN